MMKEIADSCPGHLVKSQQRGDPDLTSEEIEAELTKVFEANPANFLRRFRAYIKREHLNEIKLRRVEGKEDDGGRLKETPITDYEVEFLLKEIEDELNDKKKKTKIKNRRYAAMKSLEDDFFSCREMRRRNPLLYSDLVESNLTDEEISARRAEEREEEKKKDDEWNRRQIEERNERKRLLEMIENGEDNEKDKKSEGRLNGDVTISNGDTGGPTATASTSTPLDMRDVSSSLPSTSSSRSRSSVDNTTLSQYLLKCYDEKETNKFRDFQKAGEEDAHQEEDDDDDDDDDDQDMDVNEDGEENDDETARTRRPLRDICEEEICLLETEFESRMKEQFLVGGDAIFGVDYQQIDEDERFDDLDTLDRDVEDKWFEEDEENGEDAVCELIETRTKDPGDPSADSPPEFRPRKSGDGVEEPTTIKTEADNDDVDYLDFALDQL